jgi:hypothetical protein
MSTDNTSPPTYQHMFLAEVILSSVDNLIKLAKGGLSTDSEWAEFQDVVAGLEGVVHQLETFYGVLPRNASEHMVYVLRADASFKFDASRLHELRDALYVHLPPLSEVMVFPRNGRIRIGGSIYHKLEPEQTAILKILVEAKGAWRTANQMIVANDILSDTKCVQRALKTLCPELRERIVSRPGKAYRFVWPAISLGPSKHS